MTEFEEITIKKFIKYFLIDSIYYQINLVCGKFGISNSEISKRIGWDPAVYNQKYNRNNDLRMTTFMKIYVAIEEIIEEKEKKFGYSDLELSKVHFGELITQKELDLCRLFNHISAVAEGRADFLNRENLVQAYLSMKSFVLLGKKSKKFTDREIDVYVSYYKALVKAE
jgi:hypothetical protein